MRVGCKAWPLQIVQTSNLVLFPAVFMDSGAATRLRLPGQNPAAVHAHRHRLRHRHARPLPPMMHVILRLLVAAAAKFVADLLDQSADVPTADRHLRQHVQHARRQLIRFEMGPRFDNLAQHRLAVGMAVQLQLRTLWEKNPGDKPGSAPSVRGA